MRHAFAMGTAPAAEAIRVLLVDDNRLFVEALRTTLSSDQRVEVVGVAFDGREAIRLAAELSPDVVLMDVDMPVMSGIEATRRICEADPDVQVLIVTGSESRLDSSRAREAGAAAFIRKDGSAAQLVEAIPEVSTLLLAFGRDRSS
jgi:DNA-binding NarL/FixJ family response regulator